MDSHPWILFTAFFFQSNHLLIHRQLIGMLPHWIHLTHDFLWQLEATISFDGLQTLALLSEGRATWSPNSCAQGMAAPICFQCPWKWLYVNTTWSLNDIIQMRHSTFSLLISKYCTLHDLFAEPVNKLSVMDIPGLARTLWKVHFKIPENRIVEMLARMHQSRTQIWKKSKLPSFEGKSYSSQNSNYQL